MILWNFKASEDDKIKLLSVKAVSYNIEEEPHSASDHNMKTEQWRFSKIKRTNVQYKVNHGQYRKWYAKEVQRKSTIKGQS